MQKFNLSASVRVFAAAMTLIGTLASAAPALALTGTYNYASSGGYYTETDTWTTRSSAGYCGHVSTSCSPNSMRSISSTYTCAGTASATWDNIDAKQYGVEKVFIPSTYATTTAAPYVITYNGASTYSFRINQASYYDAWVTPSTSRFYDIRNTKLTDSAYYTCGSTTTIGADEIRITY